MHSSATFGALLQGYSFRTLFGLFRVSGPECTTPSHSQSLANSVANFHSQGVSAARTQFSRFHSQNHSHSLANSFATLIPNFCFEIWWLEFASECLGRVRIRIRIRNCIAATAVHSVPGPKGPGDPVWGGADRNPGPF